MSNKDIIRSAGLTGSEQTKACSEGIGTNSVSITVPVRYKTADRDIELTAVIDNYVIGRGEDGALFSFDWTNGKEVSFSPSGEVLKKAGNNKVRRNFWARRLVDLWTGKADVPAVKGAFAADDLSDAFSGENAYLKLSERYSSLCEALLAIVED